MSRLFFLNALLLAGIAAAALHWNGLLEETTRREAMVHAGAPKIPGAKPVAAVPAPERTVAVNYFDIASKFLFSKDRNPAVIVEPPPVKVMPALPVAYGVLTMMEPPIVMMAPVKNGPQKAYRPGDSIGEFKIVAFDSKIIQFEWDGQKFNKRFSEMIDRQPIQEAASRAPERPAGDAPAAATPAQPAGQSTVIAPAAPGKQEPGVDIGGDMRACNPGDPSPAGTTQDGFRKVISETPFGKVCRWEKVK